MSSKFSWSLATQLRQGAGLFDEGQMAKEIRLVRETDIGRPSSHYLLILQKKNPLQPWLNSQ